MKNSFDKDSSFEYQPVQTEMYSEVSHSTINNNNRNQLSDIPSEMENVLDESESIQNSNCNANKEINLNTLQSLRISHSIASPKDDATTLLERMQLIKDTAMKNEDNEGLKTPPKKENINYDGYHNNNKVQIMKDVFDCSSTENKNVIVSELDIQISTNNKNEKIANNNNTKTKKVGINLNEVFDKKAEMLNKQILNTENNSTFKPISHRIPPSSARIKMLRHEHKTNTSRPKKVDKSAYVNSSTQTSSNIGIIKTVKKKAVCSSVKKTNSKQSFYELMIKMSSKSKDKRASSYKKTNYSSNRSSSLTNKTNNSVRYHNNNTASTLDTNTGSKKKSFLIPSSGLKGKNPAPYITNFNYCATEHCPSSKTIQKRQLSQKKSNIKITITTVNTVAKKNVKLSNSKNKNTITNPNEKKKYNFNLKILQTIHSNYHKYHTTTENKSKTTNSFFLTSRLKS